MARDVVGLISRASSLVPAVLLSTKLIYTQNIAGAKKLASPEERRAFLFYYLPNLSPRMKSRGKSRPFVVVVIWYAITMSLSNCLTTLAAWKKRGQFFSAKASVGSKSEMPAAAKNVIRLSVHYYLPVMSCSKMPHYWHLLKELRPFPQMLATLL